MAVKTRSEAARAATGGLVAGLIGGAALTIFMLIGAALKGTDVWMALKGSSSVFLGERAMQPGFDALPVVLGVFIHYAISAVWGILFGLLFFGLSKGATVGAGLWWGIVVWLGMYYIVLPIVGMGAVASHVPIGQAILSHVLFGLAVALGFVPFQEHIPRRFTNVNEPSTRPA